MVKVEVKGGDADAVVKLHDTPEGNGDPFAWPHDNVTV
jgi:hypothetical protein